MIYILVGEDRDSKRVFLNKKIPGFKDPIILDSFDKSIVLNEALTDSLFSSPLFYVFDDVLKEEVSLKDSEIKSLSESKKVFIFREDKLLSATEKKYKKFANIEYFEKKENIKKDYRNDFVIANYFGMNDKLKTWISYREAIDRGVEPEAISGMLFWKIKDIFTSKNKTFTKEKLKEMSSSLVNIYHSSHQGRLDMTIALEKFILSSLGK